MKALKVLVIVLIVLVVLLGIGWFLANRYVQSPEFKQTLLTTASDAIGVEVAINDLGVSFFSGITLKGVTIANPKGFPGNLLIADGFVMRYDLLPLLRKQVHVERLAIEKPVIRLVSNARKEWNYEKVGGRPAATGTVAAPGRTGGTGGTMIGGLGIELSRLVIDDGQVFMSDASKKELLKLGNLNLTSSILLAGGELSGSGNASIETIIIANSLFVKRLAAPVNFSVKELKLEPVSGQLAGGDLAGDVTVKLLGGSQYRVDLQVKGADLDQLLQEAGAKRVVSGKLQGNAKLEGTGGLPTIVGSGRAEITNAALARIPLLDLVAALLRVPELRETKFDECLLEFTMANNLMQTPVLRFISPRIQLTGKGVVALQDFSLNHDLTLAVAKDLLLQIPKEIGALFKERPDGFLTLDFHVSGPFDAPKTDIVERLKRGAVEQTLRRGLQKLFK